MTVIVDYLGDDNPVTYSVIGSAAYNNDVDTEVLNRGTRIYSDLVSLEDSADNAADQALDQIRALRTFTAAVGGVFFDAPAGPVFPELGAVQNETFPGPLPDTVSVGYTPPNFALGLDYRLADIDSLPELGGLPSPPSASLPTTSLPTLSAAAGLPTAPDGYVFPNVTAPDLSDLVLADVVIPPAPNTPAVLLPELTLFAPEDYSGPDIDSSGVDALLDRATALYAALDSSPLYAAPPSLPGYTKIMPSVFDAISGMLCGDYFPALGDTPGFTTPFYYADYDGEAMARDWIVEHIADRRALSDDVSYEKHVRDLQRSALSLGAAAHRFMVELALAEYDLEFQSAKARAQVQLEIARGAVNLFAAQEAAFSVRAANYQGDIARLRAQAAEAQIATKQVTIQGDINVQLAEAYKIQERAKTIEYDLYGVQVDQLESEARLYAAQLEGEKAKVATARAEVAAYTATVEQYLAELQRLTNEYEVYSAQTRQVVAENSLRALNPRLQGSEWEQAGAEAQRQASVASAKATEIAATNEVRKGSITQARMRYSRSDVELQQYLTDLVEITTDYRTDLRLDQLSLSGYSSQASAIKDYIRATLTASGRAAELSQRANEELARAYTTVYDAAGRAGAAVSSGKLSGFRASASLSASDGLSAADSYKSSLNTSGTNSFSQNSSKSKSISV